MTTSSGWGPRVLTFVVPPQPLIQSDTLVHCSWYCHFGGAVTKPFVRNQTEAFFVGSRAGYNDLLRCDNQPQFDNKNCTPQAVPLSAVAAMLLSTTQEVALDGCEGLAEPAAVIHDCKTTQHALKLTLPSWLPGWASLDEEQRKVFVA